MSMSTSDGPDFLCIGAPKTGTTWLYKHLSAHPHIWIPPVKELHYFDRLFPLPKAGDKVTVRKGIFGLFPAHDRRRVTRVLARSVLRGSLAEFKWALRYFGGHPGDEWYRSLFSPAAGRIAGELTTDYCGLPVAGVRYVHALLPQLKVVFLMRNPVERAWSHAKMLLPELLGKALGNITTEEFLDYLSHPGPRARGDYITTLKNWEGAFAPTQIFIGFYEHMSSRPQSFYAAVLAFLGAPPGLAKFGQDLAARVNPAARDLPRGIPEAVARALAHAYLDDLRALAERFGGPATAWLEQALTVLNGRAGVRG